MEYMEFVRQIIKDLKNEFNIVKMDGKDKIYVAKDVTNISIPTKSMYQEYKTVGYQATLNNYIKIIAEILDTYKFKINLENIFPFIKPKTFSTTNANQNFIYEDLFCDLAIYYVADMGEVFRFISVDDLNNSDISLNTLKERSFQNLNRITNPLVQLDKAIEVYTLRFDTDYAATLFLSEHVKKQIQKKIGYDILFCMPSSTSLICAKYKKSSFETYKHILQQLIMLDKDTNKISNNIYRKDVNGNYSVIA
jgi:uncharacterized protein YtpQ (UPF0354 family)